MSSPPASITSGVNYSLKPTSVRVHRKTLNIPASNATTFNPSDTSVFYLPSYGPNGNNVMDGQSGFLKFKATITGAGFLESAGAGAFITRINTYGSGGQLISSIDNYSSLATAMVDLQFSQSDKIGLSPMMGFEETYERVTLTSAGINNNASPINNTGNALAVGDDFPTLGLTQNNRRGKTLADGTTYTFAIPLLHSLFAMQERYWPCFAMNDDTRIEIVWATAVQALVTSTNFSISQPEIVVDYLEFSDEVMPMIRSTYQGRDLVVPSQDYHYYSSYLPAGTSGTISQIIPAKMQSARMALFRFRQSYQNIAGAYAIGSSINPFWKASDYLVLNCGGVRVPQKPIFTDLEGKFSNYFASTQQALHSFNALDMNGNIPESYYNVYPANGTYQATTSSYRNAFVVAINLDRLHRQGQTSNSGMDLSSVTTYWEGKITTNPTQAGNNTTDGTQVDTFILHDVLYVISPDGSTTVRW